MVYWKLGILIVMLPHINIIYLFINNLFDEFGHYKVGKLSRKFVHYFGTLFEQIDLEQDVGGCRITL